MRTSMDIISTVLTVVSLSIGTVMVAELLIPIAQNEIDILDAMEGVNPAWGSLLGVVVTLSIVSLVLIAVTGFTGRRGRD